MIKGLKETREKRDKVRSSTERDRREYNEEMREGLGFYNTAIGLVGWYLLQKGWEGGGWGLQYHRCYRYMYIATPSGFHPFYTFALHTYSHFSKLC